LNVLKLEKVNADLIRRAYGENGMAVVTLDERGEVSWPKRRASTATFNAFPPG
jgi:hypothetical protein